MENDLTQGIDSYTLNFCFNEWCLLTVGESPTKHCPPHAPNHCGLMVSSIKEIFMVRISFILGCMLLSPFAYAKDVANNLDNDLKCIVKTVLAEGENQSRNAKVGIMYTIKNRVKLSHKSYCSVVNAKNQFSHRIVKIIPKKHKQIIELARLVMADKIPDVTNGATFFNDDSLSKNPFRHTVRTVKYDNMIFYKSLLRA